MKHTPIISPVALLCYTHFMKAPGLIANLRMHLSRFSLFQRIVIGNAVIIVFGAVIGTLVTRHLAQQATDWWLIMLFATGGILVSLTINSWIVGAALNPLRDLGRLVKRLQSGKSAISLKNPDPYTSRMATTMRSLYHELEERNRELQALSERAINAQEEERRAIARSLHDDTGQALSMLLVHLDRIDERIQPDQKELKQQMADARALAANSLTELRRILSGLAACHPGRPGPGPGDQVVRTHQSGAGWHSGCGQSARRSPGAFPRGDDHPVPHRPGGGQQYRPARRRGVRNDRFAIERWLGPFTDPG
jgi:hypothetical protein